MRYTVSDGRLVLNLEPAEVVLSASRCDKMMSTGVVVRVRQSGA
jgi:hypothetical protein